MVKILEEYYSLSLKDFCTRTSLSRRLVLEMVADGRLRTIRGGKKKVLIEIGSWLEHVAKQRSGEYPLPDYTPKKAIETRKANRAKAAKGEVDLDDLGLL